MGDDRDDGEIGELAGAMLRGVPLDRPADFLRACEEVAGRLGRTDEDSSAVDAWAARLADEASRIGD